MTYAQSLLRKLHALGGFAMDRFELFICERRYPHNVSDATISWYKHALNWLPSESPSQDELKTVVIQMREKGLKETGCNAAIRAINAYLHWANGAERKCGAGCLHPHIRPLKEPQFILPTFTDAQVKLTHHMEAASQTLLRAPSAPSRAPVVRSWVQDKRGTVFARCGRQS